MAKTRLVREKTPLEIVGQIGILPGNYQYLKFGGMYYEQEKNYELDYCNYRCGGLLISQYCIPRLGIFVDHMGCLCDLQVYSKITK